MTTAPLRPLMAVDVGNSRMKIGQFAGPPAAGLPEPVRCLDLNSEGWQEHELRNWLAPLSECAATWSIASVFREASSRLAAWLEQHRPADRVTLLTHADLPVRVQLPAPERVGIDRLLGAVAANRLRDPERSAIVIDLGSAITVDLVSAAGDFLGGAILPGIGMSARALFEQTDQLPSVAMFHLDDPVPALGTSTTTAIQAGLYWGAVGAIRELIARLAVDLPRPPQVFLTGGAAPVVAGLLGVEVIYLPHLVLAGIALVQAAPEP